MKVPLRVGAFAAPKSHFPISLVRPNAGKARRVAGLSAVAAMVVCVGAGSAVFVDYLADRARAADGPVTVRPMFAKAVDAAAEAKAAPVAAEPVQEAAAEPAQAPIEAPLPDPAAIARVAAVGPEHAIELPTDDPTASPVVRLDAVADGEAPVKLAALAAEDEPSDDTLTAAIPAEEAEPEIAPKPRKPKAARAEARETEVASLPGVDVGGLAGNPSGDDDAASTVRTVTKPAARNLGGVPAGSARVTAAVNMRSAPKKGAGVLAVVPAGSPVQVLSCDGWCQVAWNGRKGFVYKSYLSAAKAAQPRQDAEAAETAPSARGFQSPRLN